jgi:GAF domain-containing protein
VPALELARTSRQGRAEERAPARVWSWQPAPEVIERSASDNVALTALVEGAKAELKVDIAYLSLVDGTRQYYLANTGPGSRDVPLELSICRETVQGDEMLVVENSLKDPRFKDSALLDLTQLRFYAGVPLTDGAGENIGTFCVSSVLPRSKRSVPESVLRRYAEQAELELRRLASQEPVQQTAASS